MEQNLRFHQVTITPEDHRNLHNVISHVLGTLGRRRRDLLESGEGEPLSDWEERVLTQCEELLKWKDYVSQSLYQCWHDLPDGDHLKHSYQMDVWTWDDQDIASIPEDRRVPLDDIKSIGEDLVVDD